MKQIGNFISNGGYFPTNILVDFNYKVRFDIVKKDDNHEVTFGYLYLPDRYQSVWIIDGQHRLYGFAHTDSKFLDQNIVVIAFEKLSKEEEANLFVTINHEQKTVPKTLLDDLEGELKWGSKKPSERIGAVSARLVTILNGDVGEPFYNRVIQQGITATDRTCLTVPAIKDGIRRSGLIGRVVLKSKIYELGPLCGANDLESLDRARSTLNLFFTLVRDNNFGQWEKGRAGFLCTNISVQAYSMLLASLIDYMESNKGLEAKELQPQEIILEIEEYIDPVIKFISDATDKKMERMFKVQFGSGGPREYYFRLCKIVNDEFTDFNPDGYNDWEAAQSEDKIESADKKVKLLNEKVQSYIFRKFKELYGEEKNAYFTKGVINKEIQTAAFKKSLDDEDEHRLPLEHYLDFIDYKRIVEHKQNWNLFKSVFDIPEFGEKGYSKNLRWMDHINKLRRVPAHKTEQRQYRSEDFDYIDFIYEEFSNRLSNVEEKTQ